MSGLCVTQDSNGYLQVVGEYPLESCQYVVVSSQEYAGLNWMPITPEYTATTFMFSFGAIVGFFLLGYKISLAKKLIRLL